MAKKKSKKAGWLSLSWSILKDHASCSDLWKGLGLLASGGLLVLSGSLECALSFLLLGWGALELMGHLRRH